MSLPPGNTPTTGTTFLPALPAIGGPLGTAIGILGTGLGLYDIYRRIKGGGGGASPPYNPGMPTSSGPPVMTAGLPAIPSIGSLGSGVSTIFRTGSAVVGRYLGRRGRKTARALAREAALAAGFGVVGSLIVDGSGNVVGQLPNKRMNPLNPHALRRAIRRIQGARGFAKQIERCMPARRARRRC